MKYGILVCTLAAGMAWAQSPTILQNTRNQMSTVQKNATAASNEALGISQPAAAKSAPAAVRSSTAAAKPSVASAPAKSAASAPHKAAAGATPQVSVKQIAAHKDAKPAAQKKAEPAAKSNPPAAASESGDADSASSADAAKADDSDAEKDKQDKKWSMTGKRDPFISPVVNHAGGSGCSTGKKCLEIGAINLRGVVHSDAGFIAVVTNSLNKAYFLRENDPVFDGYVVKITGDSIIFKETLQDRLGKPFTREVTKKISTPAV